MNSGEELRQRLHELAMCIVAIEGEDWDDPDEDDQDEGEDAALMQSGRGSVPPWSAGRYAPPGTENTETPARGRDGTGIQDDYTNLPTRGSRTTPHPKRRPTAEQTRTPR